MKKIYSKNGLDAHRRERTREIDERERGRERERERQAERQRASEREREINIKTLIEGVTEITRREKRNYDIQIKRNSKLLQTKKKA